MQPFWSLDRKQALSWVDATQAWTCSDLDPHQTKAIACARHCSRDLTLFVGGMSLLEQAKLRFAVGTFNTWPQLWDGLRDAHGRGLVLDNFNCTGLERVFSGKTLAPNQEHVTLQALPFPDSSELIACTSGPLADCLIERLDSGARSLKEALGHWLIPRHATHLQDAVMAGNILLWIRVADAEEERRAYQNLLARSSNSVGVHDLFLAAHPRGKSR